MAFLIYQIISKKNYEHKLKIVPNFEKMLPRPEDQTLPSFMINIFNRLNSNVITDKTLQLNNYSNRDMHYDIYKVNYSFPKVKKNEEDNSIFDSKYDEDFFNDIEKIDNNKKKDKKNKVKKELDDLIKKMDKLYSDFQNQSKF